MSATHWVTHNQINEGALAGARAVIAFETRYANIARVSRISSFIRSRSSIISSAAR